MPNPYRTLLRTPGGPALSGSGLFARLPLSMAGIALLLLIVSITDSYAVGGAVQATWILVEAALAPFLARLVDQRGQWQVVAPQLVVHVLAVTALIVVVSTDAPRWTWFVTAAVAGGALPVIGSLVRARWGFLLGSDPLLRTAYSWESVVDEFVFVVGPPAATLMAVALGPSTALAVTIVIGTTGTSLLLLQRSTQPPPRPGVHGAGAGSALRYPGMVTVIAVMALLGSLFAGIEVAVIATAREAGTTAVAGVVLALWSLSSMVAGLVLGSMHRAPRLPLQLLVGTAVLTVLLLPLPFTHGLAVVGAVLLLAGFAVSPSLIAGFSLVERLVPSHRLTEGLTWVTTGLSVGFALGSSITGVVVDRFGPTDGFWVGLLAGALATVLAALGYRSLVMHEA
ncbi:MAG: MFS transporter [Actinomycetes bacterium]